MTRVMHGTIGLVVNIPWFSALAKAGAAATQIRIKSVGICTRARRRGWRRGWRRRWRIRCVGYVVVGGESPADGE